MPKFSVMGDRKSFDHNINSLLQINRFLPGGYSITLKVSHIEVCLEVESDENDNFENDYCCFDDCDFLGYFIEMVDKARLCEGLEQVDWSQVFPGWYESHRTLNPEDYQGV